MHADCPVCCSILPQLVHFGVEPKRAWITASPETSCRSWAGGQILDQNSEKRSRSPFAGVCSGETPGCRLDDVSAVSTTRAECWFAPDPNFVDSLCTQKLAFSPSDMEPCLKR